jgi:hypothetical protein
VITDTVGFIRDLPAELVRAFRATLEEMDDADLLVHVVDASDPDRDQQIRAVLFPADPVMPDGCNIKGKYAVRARVTGNVGIYHLQACRSYPGLNNSERWFCSEDDAQAAGFRKAYNCGAKSK